MVEIKPKDAKYYLELDFPLVVKHQGREIIRGKKSQNPQMINFLNLKEHQYFIPINRRHRFLKYLAGQIFIGYFLHWSFGLLFLMFAFLSLGSLSWANIVVLSPFLALTGVSSGLGYTVARRASQRMTKSLSKYKKIKT